MSHQDELELGDGVTIELNGEPFAIPAGCTVERLLALRAVGNGPLAVELNRAVLPRTRFSTCLEAGDQVEIVSFVGGG